MTLVDGHQSLLLVDSPEARRACVRFRQFLADVVHRKLGDLQTPACLVVLCAMAFDALPSKEHLLAYLKALEQIQVWGVRQYATWAIAGQTQRRTPSVFTLLAARHVDLKGADWPATVEEVERTLARCYSFSRHVKIGNRVDSVLQDGLALMEHRLPRPLFAHVAGIVPLTALTSSAWERRHEGRQPAQPDDSEEAELSEVSAAVMETVYEGDRPLSGAWFAELLHGVCDGLVPSGTKRLNRQVRHKIVSRLSKLSGQLSDVGPVEALLLGWALDIVSFGSARKTEPAVKTLKNYLKAAVRPLHRALSERQHPLSITTSEWTDLFTRLLEVQPDPLLRPALSSFQRYLVRAHDAEPIPWLFRGPTHVRLPKANILWPHELDTVHEMLAHVLHDERSVLQTQVWARMLPSTALRFGELVRLEVRSVTCAEDGRVRIAIAPSRGHPGLKTEAARRIVEVTDPAAAAAINSWTQRRKKEACSGDELLFGDPHRPDKVYRLGACYSALARAMKQVSGDQEISVHAMRHTFASFEAEKAIRLALKEFKEIRPLEELRVKMGHAHLATTLVTYCHLYEDLLRDCMDLVAQTVSVRVQDVADWTLDCTGTTEEREQLLKRRANLLRQHSHRKLGWSPWSVLHDSTRPTGVQSTSAAKSAAPPAVPKSLTLRCVHHIAADWVVGMDLPRIQLRSGHSIDVVEHVVCELQAAAAQARGVRARTPLFNGWKKWLRDEINLDRLKGIRWASAVKSLESSIGQAQPMQSARWMQACATAGINAEHAAFTDILRLLRDSGFGVDVFVIRAVDAVRLKLAEDPFMDVFTERAQAEVVSPRGGKPRAYVQVLTRPPRGEVAAPAATSDMRSLRGLLLLGVAYQQVLFKVQELK